MMRGNRVYWRWLAVAALPLALAAGTNPVASRWQKTPLAVDGEISDWTALFFHTEKPVQVDYAFGNDAENLYVLFIFKEQKYLSSIAQTGLTVWFNGEGKKKRGLGVRCERKLLPTAEVIAAMERKNGPLPPEKRAEMMAKPAVVVHQCTAVDKNRKERRPLPSAQAAAPEFVSLLKPGRLVYEIKIPLGDAFGPALAPGKNVMVGFEWGGMTAEMRTERMRPIASGGGDTSMTETPDYDRDSLNSLEEELPDMRGPKRYSFWCPLTLAAGQ